MISAPQQCHPGNADLFFDDHRIEEAVELCLNCPMKIWCRDIARNDGQLHGVWGGETADHRRAWLVLHHPDPDIREAAGASAEIEEDVESPVLASVPDMVPDESDMTPLQVQASRRALRARELLKAGMRTIEIAAELATSRRSVERYLNTKYDNVNIAA